MSEVLCDTDILSALAKSNGLDVLELVFPGSEFVITEYVRDELQKSLEAGFDFPKDIFKYCETTTLTEPELEVYEGLNLVGLSRTDKRNIVVARERNLPLLTNDSVLYTQAKNEGVEVFDLRQILRAVHETGQLSRKRVEEILRLIEERDNTVIKNKEEIFDNG